MNPVKTKPMIFIDQEASYLTDKEVEQLKKAAERSGCDVIVFPRSKRK